jgi:hypothetical protein
MALVRFVNGRWSKPPGGQKQMAQLSQRSVPNLKALLREMKQRQIIEAEDLRAHATEAAQSWNRYRIRPQREWLPASAAPKKPRARGTAISAKQRDGAFDFRVRGQGRVEIPGEPEIRLRAAGHAADIVTIRGAKLISVRVSEEAISEFAPTVKLVPETDGVGSRLQSHPPPCTGSNSAQASVDSDVHGIATATPSPGPQHAPARGMGSQPQSHPPASRTSANGGMGSPATPSLPAETLPDWIPADAWKAFVDMRAAIRRPLATTGQAHSIVRKLEELKAQGEDIRAVLEQSLRASHAEVFAVRKFADRGATPGNGRRPGVEREVGVGRGPDLPEPSFCWKCGRTKAFHGRPIRNIRREDPDWIPHEFAQNPGNAA